MYQEPGHKRYIGKSIKKCQKLCTADKKCKAFSYNEGRERCYLADAGIHYDTDFQYYEKLAIDHNRKSLTDVEDEQEILQREEKAAKKGKRDRILASIKKRKETSQKTTEEMHAKAVTKETALKVKHKNSATARLKREKKLEAHEKRMARMKAAYNEGYFKAKGVAAEKAIKEKNLKALRAKESNDKNARLLEKKIKKKDVVKKEKRKKARERHFKEDLVATKEKLVKLKNQDMTVEINKEQKMLDVAKNLAVGKMEAHGDSVEKDKAKKEEKLEVASQKTKELHQKKEIMKIRVSKQKKILETIKKGILPGNQTVSQTAVNQTNQTKSKAEGSREETAKGRKKGSPTALMSLL